MFAPKKPPLLIAAALASMLACGGGLAVHQAALAQSAQPTPARGFKVELAKGQLLQVIAPQSREDGEDARRAYYAQTIPAAEALGFKRHGQLNVNRKIISDWDPGAFIFFSWPDAASLEQFEQRPQWPAVLASRPQGWDELRIYSIELEEDLNLSFDPDKHYTVVVAWTKEGGAGEYERYLNGIEPAMMRAGGRFISKLRSPRMEAHNSAPGAPGQITFVEWDSEDGFAKVQQSAEYRASQQHFRAGVERFEFYWLKTR